nr:quinone oxidoreductase-like protein 1 [Zonotrichia albicollis]
MKALYAQQNSPGEEMTFVFQERENLPPSRAHDVKVQVRACALSRVDTQLLAEIKLKKELVPVGREISGVVLEVGSKVTFFQPDDEVVGILPLDSEESGVCEVVLVHEHYLGSPSGTLLLLGVTMKALYAQQNSPGEEMTFVFQERRNLFSLPVRLYSAEDEPASRCQLLPHKHDIITLLGVGGRWITTERNLQLDPPDSHSLFLKGATVSFLNEEVWNLSNVQQGKYLAILEDIMDKLSNGIFRPQLDEPIPLYEAKVSMEIVQKNQARKRQVIQF